MSRSGFGISANDAWDEIENVLKVSMMRWDTGSLSWVKYTGVAAGGIAQDVNVISTVLPSGASTAANQTTANTSLNNLDTKTPALGQALMASSRPVVIASNQTAVPISAAALPLPTGAATSAGLTTINSTLGSPFQAGGSIGNTAFTANAGTNLNTSALALDTTLSTMSAKLPTALGAKTTANSVAVNIASDQVVPVSMATAPSTPVTNAGTFAVQATGTVTANAGTNLNTSALALDTTLATTNTKLTTLNTTLGTPFQAGGSISNTAFQANAGTNLNTSALALESGGKLASIDTKTPALGAALKAGSVPVNIASDQTVPVSLASTPLPTNAAIENNGNLDNLGMLVEALLQETRKNNLIMAAAYGIDLAGIGASDFSSTVTLQ